MMSHSNGVAPKPERHFDGERGWLENDSQPGHPELCHRDLLNTHEHVWLGTHAEYGYPVLLHKNLLHEHMHVLGGSGSGKTSCVLAPLVTQLIRAGDSAVVIIDLKGEMAFFESVRLECERSKRTFKYFRTCRVHSGEQVKRNGRTVRR